MDRSARPALGLTNHQPARVRAAARDRRACGVFRSAAPLSAGAPGGADARLRRAWSVAPHL